MVWTLRLHELTEAHLGDAGPKAVTLGRLMRAGLPVPPGFCILATACDEQVRAAGIDLAGPELEVRRRLLESPWPPALQGEVRSEFRHLGARPVAVRSSATLEDLPDRSFAGQYYTHLGAADLESVEAAVKTCWASQCSARAVGYRQGAEAVSMAVIVQTLVPAEVSGVAFGADPLYGGRGCFVVEACHGLGEVLVSGQATPERVVVLKQTRRTVERQATSQETELVADSRGGVFHRPLDSTRRATPCLSPPRLRRLLRLLERVEALFDTPQDVEWAAQGGRVFLLQSRPITTLPSPTIVWSNANAGEIMPDVVTPLTWSLVQRFVRQIFEDGFGVSTRGAVLLERVAGRAYFNLNALLAVFYRFPVLGNVDPTDFLGGMQGRLGSGVLRAALGHMPVVSLSPRRMLALMLQGLSNLCGSGGERWCRAQRHRMQPLVGVDLAALTRDELAQHLCRCLGVLDNAAAGIASGTLGVIQYLQLFWICKRWFGDESLANKLLTGLSGASGLAMDSAEAGLGLWRLAVAAKAAGVSLHGGWETLAEEWGRTLSGRALLARFAEFGRVHGHHARGELELANARWGERPDYVLSIVQSYCNNYDRMDPDEQHRAQAKRCQDQAGALEARLAPWQKWVFRWIVRGAQRGVMDRENVKSLGVWLLWQVRRVVLEMGGRLQCDGRLDGVEDVFFLTFGELQAMWEGQSTVVDVAGRRSEYRDHENLRPPSVLMGSSAAEARSIPDAGLAADNLTVLRGLGVSAGVAEGPARVLLKSDADGGVQPGEILVAPFTDPGWTPCFLPAAAIVMDMGGLLSHGSIVAREYGIPAVVNVGTATCRIRTGQRLRVDGDRGEVHLLDS